MTEHGATPEGSSEVNLFSWWPTDVDITTVEGQAESHGAAQSSLLASQPTA
jgi:hypothetical protein